MSEDEWSETIKDETVEKLYPQLDWCTVSLEKFRELYIKLYKEEITHQEFMRKIGG